MAIPDPTGGYQCIWSNSSENPKCPHGPMLLFSRKVDDEVKKFYACSACRDRKLCKYYFDYGTEQTKKQKQILELDKKNILPRYDRQKMFIRLNEMLAENPAKRIYCHDCSRLSFVSEKHKHRGHDVAENLTDRQITHPTEILKPLDNPKKEAQFLFSKESTKIIVDILLTLGAENILCIGAPRIHEYLINNYEDKVSSLLLDFDGRFHNFFGPLNFCWYNMFNNYFFNDDSEIVFKDFLTQNNGKNTYVVCDPPFGGRVEPISQTLKEIVELHKKLNKIEAKIDELKTIFVFPYFMEPILKEKSNPPGVSGGLKELRMCDYKVDYDNHPLFAKSLERKIGSPVRIFTDIDLNLIVLPESDGYKYCKRCRKWISIENKHCKKCKNCTSKDGRRYRHCNFCERCVKPTWKHCKKCDRCALDNHKCGEPLKINGQCFKCNEFGHVEKFCVSVNVKEDIDDVSDSHLDDSDESLKNKSDIKNQIKIRNKNKNGFKKRKIVDNEEVFGGGKKCRFEDEDEASSAIVESEKRLKTGKLREVKINGIKSKSNESSKLDLKLNNEKLNESEVKKIDENLNRKSKRTENVGVSAKKEKRKNLFESKKDFGIGTIGLKKSSTSIVSSIDRKKGMKTKKLKDKRRIIKNKTKDD